MAMWYHGHRCMFLPYLCALEPNLSIIGCTHGTKLLRLKAPTRIWNHFLMKHQRNCIFINSFKFQNIHAILMFIGYQKYRKNEKNIGEKCLGVSIFFLAQPVTPQHSRGLHQGQQLTTFTVNHQPQPTICMRASKDLGKWPCIISRCAWGCPWVRCY